MKSNISIKQVAIDLLSISDQVKEHFAGHNKYDTLLSFLFAKDYYSDEDLSIPTLVEISKESGIKPHYLRKQLKEMYEEFFDYSKGRIMDFKNTEIWFSLEYFKKYAYFRSTELKFIPRVGDQITVSFLKAKLGFDYFYVKGIRHQFSGITHFIEIDLKGGFYNSFYQFRLDKAIAIGELGIGAEYNLSESEIKERLGLKRF